MPVPVVDRFTGLTVILPVVTETTSLDQTVRSLYETNDSDIRELLVVTCDRTRPESQRRCEAIADVFGDRVRVHKQGLPYLGGAMREAFDLATSSHVVMMSTDLETDPAVVPEMVSIAKQDPNCIVTASRWADGGGFTGYGRLRVGLNWTFPRVTSKLYHTELTDATFGFRLFPTAVVQAIDWDGLRHELLLETALKPLRLGVTIREIPTLWRVRDDGESQNSLAIQARYVGTLIRTRFLPASRLLKQSDSISS
jgi:hypothetical protein